MALFAVDQRGEVSFPLLLVIAGQYLCLVAWVFPLALPYGLGMDGWVLWSARRHPLGGRVYRATIGADLTFSGVLDATTWLAEPTVWLALACYAVCLAAYCGLVVVRSAMWFRTS